MSSAISIVILVIVGVAVIGGLRRGLRRELVNLAGIVLAFVGGILLAKPVSALFKHYGVIENVPYLLAFVCGFIAVSLGFSIVKRPFIPKEIDTAERISGGFVGFAKGIVFAGIVVYLLVGVWPQAADAMGRAPAGRLVAPIVAAIDAMTGAVKPLLPKDFTDQIRDGYKFFKETREGLRDAMETMQNVGETAHQYGEKAQEAAAVADSLAGQIIPPHD